MEEELLKQIINTNKALISEVKGLRSDLKGNAVDTCGPEEALLILGYKNRRYLTYFANKELINRDKRGVSYLYYKKELFSLAEKIKSGDVRVPQVRYLPQLKDD